MGEDDDLRQRIAEIGEALRQGTLNQLARAEHLAEARDLYGQLHPKAIVHGGDRKSRRFRNAPLSFTKQAAGWLGISIAMVNKILRRADRIDPLVREVIEHRRRISDNSSELDSLADLTPTAQKKIIEMIVAGKARSVREALNGNWKS